MYLSDLRNLKFAYELNSGPFFFPSDRKEILTTENWCFSTTQKQLLEIFLYTATEKWLIQFERNILKRNDRT